MDSSIFYALISSVVVSLISVVGIVIFMFKMSFVKKSLNLFVAFSVGTLAGSAILHMLPVSFEHFDNQKWLTFILLIIGLVAFLGIDALIHLFQKRNKSQKIERFGYLSLYADGVHNFTDGILIGAAWMLSPELGIATTFAVVLHEIPQEISDFGILLKAGFTTRKALWFNFLSATTAILGVLVAYIFGSTVGSFSSFVPPIIAGGFIYLAFFSLLPELFKDINLKKALLYVVFIILGVVLMGYFADSHSHEHSAEHAHQCIHIH